MVKYELEHSSGYYRIYPPLPDSGLQESKYLKFFEHSGTLFSETVASKARGEAARQLREDLKSKVDTSPSHKDKNKQSAQHKSDGSVRPESPAGSTKKRILQRPVSQRLLQAKKRDVGLQFKNNPKAKSLDTACMLAEQERPTKLRFNN